MGSLREPAWHDDSEHPKGCSDPAGCATAWLGSKCWRILSNGHAPIDQTHRLHKKAHLKVGFFVELARLARFERATAWFVATIVAF